jgi:Glycosyltransferase family 87
MPLWVRDLDGRVVAGALVAAFFVALTAVGYSTGAVPWMKVGVDARKTKFEDMRSITSSWDCERRGIQAFPNNPCDPLPGRPANYPRLWTKLGWTGLSGADTRILGVAVAILFYLAALAVPGRLSAGEGVVYAFFLLSPPTLLGVERGNVDLLMFVLVALAVLAVRRSAWPAGAAIAAAGILKLFPIFALAMLFRSAARFRAAAAAALVFGGYALLTLGDIRTILRVVPREVVNSFGSRVFAQGLRDAHVVTAGGRIEIIQAAVIAAGLAVAGGLFTDRSVWRASDPYRLEAFWAGAGVFAGTWIFGNNFDYRLVFLLLCVPQLCAWVRAGGGPIPGAALALAALAATFWLSTTNPLLPFGAQSWYVGLSFPPEEVLNWLLFGWVVAVLGATWLEKPSPLLRAPA